MPLAVWPNLKVSQAAYSSLEMMSLVVMIDLGDVRFFASG